MKKTIFITLIILIAGVQINAQQDPQYFYNQGNKQFIQSDYRSALENFDKAIELDTSLYYAYVSRAEVKTELGLYASAIADYSKYRQLIKDLNLLEDPSIVQQMENLQSTLDEGGTVVSENMINSFETYDESSSRSESSPNITITNADRWENALDYNPEDLRALFIKGNYLYQNGDYQKALSTFNKAIQVDQTVHNLYNGRGYVRLKMNDLYGAMDDFNMALSLEPNEYFSLVGRGEVKSKLRQYDQSIQDYSNAISILPNQYPAYYGRAISWFKLKNFPKAISDFSQTIQIKPDHAKAFFNRGLARYNIEETSAACADWQQSNTMGHSKAFDYIQSYCK